MKVKIFDTHVHTRDGRYLHFDVLTEGGDAEQARKIARDWLGLPDAEIHQSQCLYCHSEIAAEPVIEAIAQQGYCIIPLQGF